MTSDLVPDDDPQLALAPQGHVVLTRLKGDALSSVVNFAMTNRQVLRTNAYSSNLADFKLAAGGDEPQLPVLSGSDAVAGHAARYRAAHPPRPLAGEGEHCPPVPGAAPRFKIRRACPPLQARPGAPRRNFLNISPPGCLTPLVARTRRLPDRRGTTPVVFVFYFSAPRG